MRKVVAGGYRLNPAHNLGQEFSTFFEHCATYKKLKFPYLYLGQ